MFTKYKSQDSSALLTSEDFKGVCGLGWSVLRSNVFGWVFSPACVTPLCVYRIESLNVSH